MVLQLAKAKRLDAAPRVKSRVPVVVGDPVLKAAKTHLCFGSLNYAALNLIVFRNEAVGYIGIQVFLGYIGK